MLLIDVKDEFQFCTVITGEEAKQECLCKRLNLSDKRLGNNFKSSVLLRIKFLKWKLKLQFSFYFM